MGLFGSSGKKYKRAAEQALQQASDIKNYQSEVDFRRTLLSNIRQERMARAQLEQGGYSTTFRSSSQAGAIANIDSSLAGETRYGYETSYRSQRIEDLNTYAQDMYRKYEKAQQKKAGVGSIVGTVAGVGLGLVTGGLGFGLTGAALAMAGVAGGQIGQGIGQVASNTGWQQTQYGVNNILSGASQGAMYWGRATDTTKPSYTASSLNPTNNQIIPGSTVYYNSTYEIMKNMHP